MAIGGALSARCWGASSCPSWRRATSGSAPPCPLSVSLEQSPSTSAGCAASSWAARHDARAILDKQPPRGGDGGLAARAPRRRHRRRRASTTSSSSRPSSPSTTGRKGVTKDCSPRSSPRQLAEAFPGVVFNFSQYISDNVEEAMSGVKGENTVKVMGPDLEVNEAEGRREIVEVHGQREGGRGPGHLHARWGSPTSGSRPTGTSCGRYGLNVGDVEAVIQAAIGGPGRHPGLRGREALRPHGPLAGPVTAGPRRHPRHPGDHARWLPGPPGPDGRRGGGGRARAVYREDSQRYAPVKFSVRGRDLASHHRRRPAAHRRQGQAALRHPPGVGGRDQPAQRGHRAAGAHPPASPCCSSPSWSTRRSRTGATCSSSCWASRWPASERILALLITAHQLLDLRGHGLHLHLRHRDPGLADRGHLRPAAVERRGIRLMDGSPGRGAAAPPGADDHLVAMLGLSPRRSPTASAPRPSGRWRSWSSAEP